eukprot:scaffold1803_cov92-Amphora_coffeaeformis.AAC.44
MSQGRSAGSSSGVNEVYYNEGATPLFLAVEDTDWRLALQIAQDEPKQASTWVVSTGTVETTFHWNLWRRLPLHEACRRQAPAWFISLLLSIYPSSARQRTQFGELPLHLAVECGAPPEVVNLIIVAHWPAIVATDQSGRTPLSICQDAEMLALEDHKVVHESLTRSMETYQQILNRHEMDMESLKATHAAGLAAIRKQHDDDLQVEQEQQEKLLQEVQRLKLIVQEAEQAGSNKAKRIDDATASNEALQRQVQSLQDELNQENKRYDKQTQRVTLLEKTLKERGAKIDTLNKDILQLRNDLQQIASWQDQELQRKIVVSEDTMQVMVEHFCGLTEMLTNQSERVRQTLRARNIPLRHEIGGPTDEKKDIDQEDDITDSDALASAALAASGALGLGK